MSEVHHYSKIEVRKRGAMRRETHRRGKTWATIQDATATVCPGVRVKVNNRPMRRDYFR